MLVVSCFVLLQNIYICGEALHVTTVVKARLAQPYIMYHTVDKYNEIVVGWSLSKRLKKAWADNLLFHNYGHV